MGKGVCLTHEREAGSSRTGFDDVVWFGERTPCDRFPRMLIHKFSQTLFVIIRGIIGIHKPTDRNRIVRTQTENIS